MHYAKSCAELLRCFEIIVSLDLVLYCMNYDRLKMSVGLEPGTEGCSPHGREPSEEAE
jgi:hypothetical protein